MGVPPLDDPGAPAETVLNTLRWCAHGATDPVDLRRELPPEEVQAAPTVMQRAARAGVAVTTIAPEIQRRSGLTRAALRGGRFHGVSALGDLAAARARRPRRGSRPRSARSATPTTATSTCSGTRTARARRRGCMQLDGHRPARRARSPRSCRRTRCSPSSPTTAWSAPTPAGGSTSTPAPSCSPVCAGSRARPACATCSPPTVPLDDVAAAWRSELGDAAWVRTRDEAIAEGWFGLEVTDAARGRIGDVVAAAQGNWTLVRSRIEPMETALDRPPRLAHRRRAASSRCCSPGAELSPPRAESARGHGHRRRSHPRPAPHRAARGVRASRSGPPPPSTASRRARRRRPGPPARRSPAAP